MRAKPPLLAAFAAWCILVRTAAGASPSMTGFELRVARSSSGVTMVAGMDNRFQVNGVTVFSVGAGVVNASTCAGEAARSGYTYYAFTNNRCFGARDLVEAAIDPTAERLVPNMAALFNADFGLVERACDAADSNYYCSLRPASNATSANALYVIFVRLCAGAQRNCGGVCSPPSNLGCCPLTETAQISTTHGGSIYLCQESCPTGQVRVLHPLDGYKCEYEEEICFGNRFNETMQCCINPDSGCCTRGRSFKAGDRCVTDCPAGTIAYGSTCDSPTCRGDSVYTQWNFALSSCVEPLRGCTPQQVWSPARGACSSSCAPGEARSGRECVAAASPSPSPSPSPGSGGVGGGGDTPSASPPRPKPSPAIVVAAAIAGIWISRRAGGGGGGGGGNVAYALAIALLVASAATPSASATVSMDKVDLHGYISLMSASSPALPLECIGTGLPYSDPVDGPTCHALAMSRGHNYWTNSRDGTCCTSRTLFAGNFKNLTEYRKLVSDNDCVSYTFANATRWCGDERRTPTGSTVDFVYPCAVACKIQLEYRNRLADGGGLLVKDLYTEVYARVHKVCPTLSVNCEGTCEAVGALSTTSNCRCCSKQAEFQDDPLDPTAFRCVPRDGGCGNAYRAVVDNSTGCAACVDVATYCGMQGDGWTYSPTLQDCINAQGCPLARPVRFQGECIRTGECPFGYTYSAALGTCVLSAKLACTPAVGNWSDAKTCCVTGSGCCSGMFRLPKPPTSLGDCRFDCPASMVRNSATNECWTPTRAYCETDTSSRERIASEGLCRSKEFRQYCYFRATPTSEVLQKLCSDVVVEAPLGARPRRTHYRPPASL